MDEGEANLKCNVISIKFKVASVTICSEAAVTKYGNVFSLNHTQINQIRIMQYYIVSIEKPQCDHFYLSYHVRALILLEEFPCNPHLQGN